MSDLTPGRSVRVRVPASSANLGPGFDALGLALARYDEVEITVTDGGVDVDVDGAGAGEVPLDEGHLVAASTLAYLRRAGAVAPGLHLRCRNRIPQSRGLGSSAAAIVAGVLGAHALCDGAIRDAAVLTIAAELEGHPDNVAACVAGGVTIAWYTGDPLAEDQGGGQLRVDAFAPDPSIVPVVFVPPYAVSTVTARAALPGAVTHADAASNAGRAALLVRALTARPDLLFDATEDLLHQAYRAPVMAESVGFLRGLRAEGVAAVVSGAGPTVLALTTAEPASLLRRSPPGWHAEALAVDLHGASVMDPD